MAKSPSAKEKQPKRTKTSPLSRLKEEGFGCAAWTFSREEELELLLEMYEDVGALEALNVERGVVKAMLAELASLYVDVPYHCWSHGVDVTIAAYLFATKLGSQALLSRLELALYITAAICHDVGHPGLNSAYHRLAKSELQQRHGDDAMLEKHHVATMRATLAKPENDVLSGLGSDAARAEALGVMEYMILGTDMAAHTACDDEFEGLLAGGFGEPGWAGGCVGALGNNRLVLLRMLLKAADLGNCGKPFVGAKHWADCLVREGEFQRAKEAEAGVATAPAMQLTWENEAAKQAWFLENMVVPMFELLGRAAPGMQAFVEMLRGVVAIWKQMEAEAAVKEAAKP